MIILLQKIMIIKEGESRVRKFGIGKRNERLNTSQRHKRTIMN